MSSASLTATAQAPSTVTRWVGRIATALVALFLIFDLTVKLLAAPMAVEATVALGFSASQVRPIGLILLICLILYLIPRTAPLGAVLLTGYLGGAVAIQLRAGNPLAGYVLFPIYVAVFAWGGLYPRDPRVRAFIRK